MKIKINLFVDRKFRELNNHSDSVNKITDIILAEDNKGEKVFKVCKPKINHHQNRFVRKFKNIVFYLEFHFSYWSPNSINLFISESSLNASALLSSSKNYVIMHGAEFVSHPNLRARSRYNFHERFSRLLLHWLSFRVMKFLFVSHWAAGVWLTWLKLGHDRGLVIGNPIKVTEKFNIKITKEKIILFVGNIKAQKNLQNALEAFNSFNNRHPEYVLKLVGPGHKEYQNKNIVVEGVVSEEKLSSLYAHSEILLFPSLVESFGMPTIEALLHDVKVVTSHTSCLPEITRGNAYFCDPYDIASIVSALENAHTSNDIVETDWIYENYAPGPYLKTIMKEIGRESNIHNNNI
jgi:glycosyltransferase involved in cell wall biosynthesis